MHKQNIKANKDYVSIISDLYVHYKSNIAYENEIMLLFGKI